MPRNPYDAYLDEMFGPVGSPAPMPQGNPYEVQPLRQRKARPTPPIAPAKTPGEEMSDLQRYGAFAARGIGGLLGFTPLTGAAGGAAGEILGQAVEQWDLTPELDYRKVAAEAATGAVGGKFAKMLGSLVGAPIKAAMSGAALGGVAPVLRHGIGEGNWDPTQYAGEVALGAGISGATGGALAHFLKVRDTGLPAPPNPAGTYQVETTSVPGGRTLGASGKPEFVGPIPPIHGTGIPDQAPVPMVDDTRIPYTGGAGYTTRSQHQAMQAEDRGLFAALNKAMKSQEQQILDAQKTQRIADEMAAAGVEAQPPTFGSSVSAKQPDGSTLRMSQRFAAPAEEGGDDLGQLLAGQGPDAPMAPAGPADVASEIARLEEAIAAAQRGIPPIEPPAGGIPMGGPDVPPMPPAPALTDPIPGPPGQDPMALRRFLQMSMGDMPGGSPAGRRVHPLGPEPIPPPMAPEAPLPPVEAPPATSPLAEVLTPGKAGKTRVPKARKGKSDRFADKVAKLLGQVDEGVPPAVTGEVLPPLPAPARPVDLEIPSSEELIAATGPKMRDFLDDGELVPHAGDIVTPAPGIARKPEIRTVTDINGNNRVWIDGEEFTDRFGPGGPTMSDIMSLQRRVEDPAAFRRLDELKGQATVGFAPPLPETAALPAPAQAEPGTSPLNFLRGSRADVLGEHYRGLQDLLKGSGEKMGKEFRDVATSALSPTPVAQGARIAGKGLRTMASEAAPKAAEAVPPSVPLTWEQEAEAEIARLAGMTPEARAAALAGQELPPTASLAGLNEPPAVPEVAPSWVQDELDAIKAYSTPPVVPEVPPSAEQVSELAKLLKASGAIRDESEIPAWVQAQVGDLAKATPPPVAPTSTSASRQALRQARQAEGGRPEPPNPQDYKPTYTGPKSEATPTSTGQAVPEAPQTGYRVSVAMSSKNSPRAIQNADGEVRVFNTPEEAEALAAKLRESGKFAHVKVDGPPAPKTDLKPRLRKKGEKGEIPLELMAKLGLGVAGAATGAAVDPLDNPVLSALAGGAIGASVPTVVSALTKLGANPGIVQQAVTTAEHTGNFQEAASKIAKTLPQAMRFNYLMDFVGLPANALAGPWGSGVFGTLEKGLAGDARGWAAFQELSNPANFLKEYWPALDEAKTLVGRAEGYALSEASTLTERGLAQPGTMLTAGDIAIRRILQRHGFSEDEARIMTLTGEPFTKTGLSGAHLRGLGWDMTFPFKRTPINIAEQGFLRTPGIGFAMQAAGEAAGTRAADPFKQQLIQQGIGAGIGIGSEQLSEQMDPEQAKFFRRFVTNAAGPYSLLAGLGFATGQARRRGNPKPFRTGLLNATDQLPLPSVDVIKDAVTYASDPENARIPRGAYPAAALEQLKYIYDETHQPSVIPRRRR